MTTQLYLFVHVVGLIFLFAGFGSLLSADEKARKTGGMLHGIGLLIILIAAFGFIARARKENIMISYGSTYVIVKSLIWLVLGFLPVLAKRRVMSPKAVLFLAIALGICAAYIGELRALSQI
jgi:hypothetical protein